MSLMPPHAQGFPNSPASHHPPLDPLFPPSISPNHTQFKFILGLFCGWTNLSGAPGPQLPPGDMVHSRAAALLYLFED